MKCCVFFVFTLIAGLPAHAADSLDIAIGWLRVVEPPPPTLSNLDPTPPDLARAGARLAIEDNARTGGFLGHEYRLIEAETEAGGDVARAARALLAETDILVIDTTGDTLLTIADMPEASDALLFNATAEDVRLRSGACRANILHTAASLSMRADALSQFLVAKKWTDLGLITGTHDHDLAFSAALKASAGKFRLSIKGEKTWAFDADMRRNAASEVPLFTQDLGDHDVLIIADEIHDWGRYVPFNTWLARPVAGSEGLVPLAWSPVVEQWGAAQLQSRFHQLAGRDMAAADYGAWAAIRTIGEAVTRTNAADAAAVRDYILSDAFELAGFKGRKLTFRDWNGQMRQPIHLVHRSAQAALAPLEGFLHQENELDTLGLDRPESQCTAFGG